MLPPFKIDIPIYIYIHIQLVVNICIYTCINMLLLMYALCPYTICNAQGLSRFMIFLNTKMSKSHTPQTHHMWCTRSKNIRRENLHIPNIMPLIFGKICPKYDFWNACIPPMPLKLKTQWAQGPMAPCGRDIFGVTWSNFYVSKVHSFRNVQALMNVVLYVSPSTMFRLRGVNKWQKCI